MATENTRGRSNGPASTNKASDRSAKPPQRAAYSQSIWDGSLVERNKALNPARDYGWGMDETGNPTNPVSALLDILSRPNYAVAQTAADMATGAQEAAEQGGIGGAAKLLNPFGGPASAVNLIGNLIDNDKRSISGLFRGEEFTGDNGRKWNGVTDALAPSEEDSGLEKFGKGAAGLGIDIFADPSTYIGVGAIKSVGRGVADALPNALRRTPEAPTPAQPASLGAPAASEPVRAPQSSTPVQAAPEAPVSPAEPDPADLIQRLLANREVIPNNWDQPQLPDVQRAAIPGAAPTVGNISEQAPNPQQPNGLFDVEDVEGKPLFLQPEETEDVISQLIRPADNPELTVNRAGKPVQAESKLGQNYLEKPYVPSYDEVVAKFKDESGSYLSPFTKTIETVDLTPTAPVDAVDDVLPVIPAEEVSDAFLVHVDNLVQSGKFKPINGIAARYIINSTDEAPDALGLHKTLFPRNEGKLDIQAMRELGTLDMELPILVGKTLLTTEQWIRAIQAAGRGETVSSALTQHFDEVKKFISGNYAGTKPSRGPRAWFENLGTTVDDIATQLEEFRQDATPASRAIAEAAKKAPEKVTEIRTVWGMVPPNQQNRVRMLLKNNLDREHYDFIYADDYYKNKALTIEQKAAEFKSRLKQVLRGKPVTDGRKMYETFRDVRTIVKPRVAIDVNPANRVFNPGVIDTVADQKSAAEILAEAPVQSVEEARAATNAAKEASLRANEILNPEQAADLKRVLGAEIESNVPGQGWGGMRGDFEFESGIQGTKRNSPVLGQGLGINQPTWNAKAQANYFKLRMRKWSAAAKESKLSGRDRSRFLLSALTSDLKRVDLFMRARNVSPIAVNSAEGIPLSLGETFEAFSKSSAGRDFLYNRLFNRFGRSPEDPGTVFADSVHRVAGAAAALMSHPSIIDVAREVKAGRKGVNDLREQLAQAIDENGGALDDVTMLDLVTDSGRTPVPGVARDAQGNPVFAEGRLVDDYADAIATPELAAGELGFISADQLDASLAGYLAYGPASRAVVNDLWETLFKDPEGALIVGRLVEAVQTETARLSMSYGQYVKPLTDEVMQRVLTDLDEVSASTATGVLSSAGRKAMAKEAAVANGDVIDDSIAGDVANRVGEEVSSVIPRIDTEQADVIARIEKNLDDVSPRKTNAQRATENKKAANEASDIALKEMATEMPGPGKMDEVIQGSMERIAGNIRQGYRSTSKIASNLTNHGQFPNLHQAFLATGTLTRSFSDEVKKSLSAINRLGPRSDQQRAFSLAIQAVRGGNKALGDAVVNPNVAQMRDRFATILKTFFDSKVDENGVTSVMSHMLNRGIDVDHWIDTMNSPFYKFSDDLKFDRLAIKNWEAKAPGIKAQAFLNHIFNSEAVIDDPIDYLSRMDHVVSSISRDMAMSQESYKVLKALDGVSQIGRPGMVKFSAEEVSENLLTRYFPVDVNQPLYIDKNLASEIVKIDRAVRSRGNFDGELGKLFRWTDPLLAMFKSGMTIWRTGHHMRNLVGDISSAFILDGVKDPNAYYKAIKLLANSRMKYDSVDYLAMLQGIEKRSAAARGMTKPIMDVRHRGRKVQMSDSELVDVLTKKGMFKSFSVGEDIIQAENTPELIKKFQSAIQAKGSLRGRPREFVGTVSEARDDFVRLGHAIDLINKGRIAGRWGGKDIRANEFKNYEDYLQAVVNRVNQAHPDGSDLTQFESKWMRRIFPFYSWTRKAIPLVLESMFMHPGRVLMYPKASYNFALQNGVDLESMSDPFPDDQMFPSWLSDNLTGPVYKDAQSNYFGVSPGVIDQDILTMFNAGDPGTSFANEALSQLNPMLRAPAELMAGNTLTVPWDDREGINISDSTEYIGQQIPGISQAQSISGYDILGSLIGGPDQLNSVEKGNRETFDQNKILNWLLGIGTTNMSTPSAINSAEIEMRNAG